MLSESEPTELLGGLSGKIFDLLSLLPPPGVLLALVSTSRIEPEDEDDDEERDELGLMLALE